MAWSWWTDGNCSHVDSHYARHDIWLVGLCLALCSITLSSVGLILQRAAHLRRQQEEGHRCPWKYVFVIGTVVYLSASGPDVISYALLPQAIVSNISCCKLVLVAVLSHCCLDERIGCRAVLGILLCVCGTFLCLNFGPRPEMYLDSTPLGFFTPAIAVYLAAGFTILLFLLVLEHLQYLIHGNLGWMQNLGLPFATALAYGLEKVFNTGVGFAPHKFWETPEWLAVYLAIGLLGFLDFYLNMRGVERLPVQVFVPAVFGFGTSICYFQSVCIFHEMQGLSWTDFAVSLAGMLMSLLGALCIHPPSGDSCEELPAFTSTLLPCEAANGDSGNRDGCASEVLDVQPG